MGPVSPGKANTTNATPTTNVTTTSVTTPTTNLVKKFKLAEFRYGKEELLQLFTQDPKLPSDMPLLAPICLAQPSTPLAFIPLSEEEQVCEYLCVHS